LWLIAAAMICSLPVEENVSEEKKVTAFFSGENGRVWRGYFQ
jgi:hypothetical protein